MPRDAPSYEAPEVYGEGVFDPVTADVWSIGAVVYNMLTNAYPYDINDTSADVSHQIEQSVASNVKASHEGQQFLNEVLRRNPDQRLTVNKILSNRWTKKFRS